MPYGRRRRRGRDGRTGCSRTGSSCWHAAAKPAVAPRSRSLAGRHLVAGTYMAGELRRYWAFAATLALGTGHGRQPSPGAGDRGHVEQQAALPAGDPRRPSGAPLRELLAIATSGDGHGGIGMTGNAITGSRLRVAQVITRFMAGAGWVALSGALALDPDCYRGRVRRRRGRR